MRLTPDTLAIVFAFIKQTAFYDIALPPGIRFRVRRMKGAEGEYHFVERRLTVNPKYGRNVDKVLRITAHEMCHAALGQRDFPENDPNHHDQTFNELTAIVCERMGWKKDEIL